MESRIRIIRSKRRTLALSINHEGEIIIKAPQRMASKQIVDFVKLKKRWIQKNIAKKRLDQKKALHLDISKEELVIIKERSLITLQQETLSQAKVMNLTPANIKTTSATTLWGSCTSDNVIRLNWRLLLVPQECREYVIIHELAHIQYKNHSKYFWTLVGQYCPDYKNIRQKLKEYSYLLRAV